MARAFGGFTLSVELAPVEQMAGDMVQQPSPEIMQQGLREAAEEVRNVWYGAVMGNLLPGMSRPVFNEEYANSLQTGDSIQLPSPWWAVVLTTYAGAMRIERGYGPFDIKKGLLASPNAKHTRDGRPYQDIPFRHGTPGGTGFGGSRVHFPSMPKEIYAHARRLPPNLGPGSGAHLRGGEVEWWGMRSKNLAFFMNREQQLKAGFREESQARYTWKAGLYAGMVRPSHPYESQPQQFYMTFRRVSDKSDPASWWHPGVAANPLIQAVLLAAKPEVTRILTRAYCTAIGRPDLFETAQMAGTTP